MTESLKKYFHKLKLFFIYCLLSLNTLIILKFSSEEVYSFYKTQEFSYQK